MTTARLESARKNSVVLGDCLLALSLGEDGIDARVGAIRLAEFVNVMIAVNTKR